MRIISVDELKRSVSAFVEAAAKGTRIIVTRRRRPVAALSPAGLDHVHVGARFGQGTIEPLRRTATRGQYLEVLAEDRRPAGRDP